MSSKGPKSLSELLDSEDSAVRELASEASQRLALADRLRSSIEPDLAVHLTGANLREDGTLVLLTTSPEWAARLRYEATRLLTACREQYPAAARVRVRVTQPD